MTIHVSVSGGGSVSQGTLTAQIVDLDKNPPPDPQADDRNDAFHMTSSPRETPKAAADWSVWRPWWQEHWVRHGNSEDGYWWCDHGWWMFGLDRYRAELHSSMVLKCDSKNPTASGSVMKSGYGVNQMLTCSVTTKTAGRRTGCSLRTRIDRSPSGEIYGPIGTSHRRIQDNIRKRTRPWSRSTALFFFHHP